MTLSTFFCYFDRCLLPALLARVKSVEGDVEKLTSGNAMLKTYIDNLTVQMAKRR
jgi:short coiled-coil protein